MIPGQGPQALVHNGVQHRPELPVGGPQTPGLQQVQGSLLLGLQPQQPGALDQQQAMGFGEGLGHGLPAQKRRSRMHHPNGTGVVVTVEKPTLMPSEACLALHHQHRLYASFDEFRPDLADLLAQGQHLDECARMARLLGVMEPLTDRHILPEQIEIKGPNYRESLMARGCLSRHRALLLVLQQLYGGLEELQEQRLYLVEAVTGFALWMKHHLRQLTISEFFDGGRALDDADIEHQDLCHLTYASESFDLVVANELLEHVYDLPAALTEIMRVLRPGGRLLATFPMAFGQWESIIKARRNPQNGETELLVEPDYHGDPIRPEQGSLVYQIPGWEVLEQAQQSGYHTALMHCLTSWKFGVLGGDLSGVLVFEAQK